MNVKVQTWGNSLGLRIPKAYAAELGVRSGSEMELKVEAGTLLVRPVEAINLEELLEKVTTGNQHSETDWGEGSGQEVW
jgi:antitoxin MazE